MSTKIYTGFKLPVPIDRAIPYLKECKQKLSPFVQEIFREGQVKTVVELAARIEIDQDPNEVLFNSMIPQIFPRTREYLQQTINKPLLWAHDLGMAWEEQAEFCKARTDINYDFYFHLNLCLYPYDGETYGVAFGADKVIEKFLDLPEVSDFHYQNQTDKPDEISEEEWKYRGKVWDDILGYTRFSENAFQYCLFCADDLEIQYIGKQDVTQHLNEHRDEWLQRYLRNQITLMIMEEVPVDQRPREVSWYVDAHQKACEEIKNGSDRVTAVRKDLEATFPHTYEDCFHIIAERFPGTAEAS